MAMGLLGRIFTIALGGTGAAATYSHLKKEENREEIAETTTRVVSEAVSEPAEAFNNFADGSLEFFKEADRRITNYGNSVIETGKAVADPLGTAKDAFGLNAGGDGQDNEGGGWWKWLLGGGAAIAGGGLLSKMFGKSNENDSGGGLGFGGTLLLVGAVIGVALDAFGIRTKLTNMFNELTGSDERTMDITQDTSAEQNVRVGRSFFEDGPEAPSL